MSIVSSQLNKSSSNLLHSVKDSTLKKKKYIKDLETFEENKRVKTAPPSPPSPSISTTFKKRSLSQTPPLQSTNIEPIVPLSSQYHKNVITPSTPPTSVIGLESIIPSSNKQTKLPSINSITSNLPLNFSDYKYLKQNNRYGSSHHSLDYPDTCINDDDWRMNMEIWFEKNFLEKFNNLKNLLRFDKPGFDLLNDAIFLNELKEKLNTERKIRKIDFNSKISKKMISSSERRYNPYYHQKRIINDLKKNVLKLNSNSNSNSNLDSSKYSASIVSNVDNSSTPIKLPTESNYTYNTSEQQSQQQQQPQREPHSPITLSMLSASRNSSISSSKTTDYHSQQSSPIRRTSNTSTSPRQWNGHHQLSKPAVLETSTFIHTHNHKGPNHTYTIHHHIQSKRECISCGSDQSPCWRPSWSSTAGQLCNSCGLRYKKTGARCMMKNCGRIPAKGEWTAMKNRGKTLITGINGINRFGYSCLHCDGEVEVKEKIK